MNGLLLAVLCPASLEKVLVKRLQEQNKGADEVSDRRTAWRRVFNWVDLDKSGIVTPDELGKVRRTTATGATASLILRSWPLPSLLLWLRCLIT